MTVPTVLSELLSLFHSRFGLTNIGVFSGSVANHSRIVKATAQLFVADCQLVHARWYTAAIMTMTETFGGRLQTARFRRGWSPAELARAAELSESTVYRIEGETRCQPRAPTIAALADALDVTTDELLGREELTPARGIEPLGEMVDIPLVTRLAPGDRLDAWTGEVWALRKSTLPQDCEPDTVCAFRQLTDAMQPAIQPSDVLLIVLAATITDGQVALLWDPDAERNIVRRVHILDDVVIATGDAPGATPVTLSRDDVLGIVLKIVDRDVA